MKQAMRISRQGWLIATLVILAAASAGYYLTDGWTPKTGMEKGNGVGPASSAPANAQNTADASIAQNDSASPAKPAIVDVFAVRTWEPPPPAVESAPPAPPQAPPFPFKSLGRIIDPPKDTIFLLTRGKDTLAVSVGDTIDGIYRVDKYDNGQLHFVYRPLNSRQSLFVGSE